jgi:hypothetical protein
MDDKYFEDARTMFLTEGWTTFQAELDEAIAACTLEGCNTTEEFWQMKGRILTLRQIAGYQNLIHAAEEQGDADA